MSSKKHEHTLDSTSSQFERFVETAHALGCDEDKERFEAALGKIAAHKPKKPSPAGPRSARLKKAPRG
jgi:hypothetical protein